MLTSQFAVKLKESLLALRSRHKTLEMEVAAMRTEVAGLEVLVERALSQPEPKPQAPLQS